MTVRYALDLDSVLAARSVLLFKRIAGVFPDRETIDRTWVSTRRNETAINLVSHLGGRAYLSEQQRFNISVENNAG